MSLRNAILGALLLICGLPSHSLAADKPEACRNIDFNAASFTVCEFSAKDADVRLFWGEGDRPYGSFKTLDQALGAENQRLLFAMNAGMYHKDRSPVGLYIDQHGQRRALQTRASSGNFGLLPNGVFHRTNNGLAVTETKAFEAQGLSPKFATQSGPMLVIGDKLHPKFNQDSKSKRIRNGVGVSADGQRVYFGMSERPVNFYSFASLFKDELKTPNALYLDGVISRLFDASSGRHDYGVVMGPIVAVVGANGPAAELEGTR